MAVRVTGTGDFNQNTSRIPRPRRVSGRAGAEMAKLLRSARARNNGPSSTHWKLDLNRVYNTLHRFESQGVKLPPAILEDAQAFAAEARPHIKRNQKRPRPDAMR